MAKPYIDTANYIEPEIYREDSDVEINIPEMGVKPPKDSDYDIGYFYR